MMMARSPRRTLEHYAAEAMLAQASLPFDTEPVARVSDASGIDPARQHQVGWALTKGFQLGVARVTDPTTSHQAAAKQRGGVPAAILAVFATGAELTDDELARRLPRFLASTVKTARSRLAKAELLVDTRQKRPGLSTGSTQIVWRSA